MDNEIKHRDYPILGWVLGAVFAGVGAFYAFAYYPQGLLFGGIGLAVSIALLTLSAGLTITANKQTRTLRLDYRSLISHSVKELRFDDIAAIRIESRQPRGSRRRRGGGPTYCIIADMKNGEKVPFRSYYSSDFIVKQATVNSLRKFIDLPESLDQSPVGMLRAAPKLGEIIARTQQQEAEPNIRTYVTNGVNWQLRSVGMANTAMRWFSPDFKTQGGFLFLAQKPAGQSSSGFMASLSNVLFKQAAALYGFSEGDTPNIAQSEIYTGLSPELDKHFTALTSDPAEARQILNPWMQNPLADWGKRHPLKQIQIGSGGSAHIVVLYSPNGVYIATPAELTSEQTEEITQLGVELVKSQGAQ